MEGPQAMMLGMVVPKIIVIDVDETERELLDLEEAKKEICGMAKTYDEELDDDEPIEELLELQAFFLYRSNCAEVTENSLQMNVLIGKGAFATVRVVRHIKYGLVAYKKFRSTSYKNSKAITDHPLREVSMMATDAIREYRYMFVYCLARVVPKKGEVECGLLFELMHGNLQDVLDEDIAYGAAEICIWGWQVAKGLLYLHYKGLIHRDIRPANIFIDDTFIRCKIGDFGCYTKSDYSKNRKEKDVYCAPEVRKGRSHIFYSPASDVFSLATTLDKLSNRTLRVTPLKDPALLNPMIRCCTVELPGERPLTGAVWIELERKRRHYCRNLKPTKLPTQ